ncbi:MAG: Amidophosphoribosyltransferase [Pseudomonadota bacterium]|jgi:amidophosphoribosyltransferase
MFDKLREQCGVVGLFGIEGAAPLAVRALQALQHRGQESAGLAVGDGERLRHLRGTGLVADVCTRPALEPLTGDRAIGHVRYATAGTGTVENAQPLLLQGHGGPLAVAHNGHLVNADALRERLEASGALFGSTTDTEVILHLVAREREGDLAARIVRALGAVEGAYSLVFLARDRLLAVRDPSGFRPLVLGRRPDGAWMAASETCALTAAAASFVREVEAGELVEIDAGGLRSHRLEKAAPPARCVFELVYFARADSDVFGRSVHAGRTALGRRLARTSPAPADVVVAVPDSGVPAGLGFAHEAGLPFEHGVLRHSYERRTFIEPHDEGRAKAVREKLAVVPSVVRGRRVAVVDDSLVRGTTARHLVRLLREAGAREVHLRIAAPPTRFPCFWGIDTPDPQELAATHHDAGGLARLFGADSLAYLPNTAMFEALDVPPDAFCDACFSGVPKVGALVPLGR